MFDLDPVFVVRIKVIKIIAVDCSTHQKLKRLHPFCQRPSQALGYGYSENRKKMSGFSFLVLILCLPGITYKQPVANQFKMDHPCYLDEERYTKIMRFRYTDAFLTSLNAVPWNGQLSNGVEQQQHTGCMIRCVASHSAAATAAANASRELSKPVFPK